MNVYDFDQTIFQPDSSYAFFLYCMKRYPAAFLKTAPTMLLGCLRYLLKRTSTKALKEKVFSFLRYVPEPEKAVMAFWDEHFSGVEDWYLAQRCKDDLIITASPSFLVGEAGQRLGVRVLGTEMDIRTGRILGENCHDAEKVRRFYQANPNGVIERFYSDSLSDTPLAEIANKAFLVDKGRLSDWPGTS